jgi:ferredoxin-type protein NapF
VSLSSFFASKCLEYLFNNDDGHDRTTRRELPHPPWSIAAEQFRTLCTGCGACVEACPRSIIALPEDKLPIMDFSQNFCMFCGECARSCPSGALRFEPEQPPWRLRARIADNCLLAGRVLCRTCGDHCVKGAIAFSPADGRLPEIAAAKCDGCGACVGVCPVGAIFLTGENE